MSERKIIVPEGYQLLPGDVRDRGSLKKAGEWVMLTNRPFEGYFSDKDFGVNWFFRELPSKIINHLVAAKGGSPIIVDLGGGIESTCARDIAELHPPARVINIDFAVEDEQNGNFEARRGDATALPLENESVNFVYSRQLFRGFDLRNDFAKHRKVIAEIDRILARGGVALIDEENFSWFPPEDRNLRGLVVGLEIDVLPMWGPLTENFLFFSKQPLDPKIAELREPLIRRIT